MRPAILIVLCFGLVLAACGTRDTTSSRQARVRNEPPTTCTELDFAQCPELALEACPDGQEPVIDYSADCCPHFSCQPQCLPDEPCPGWPAPICPPGTSLIITTATDCCPAYRCEPLLECDPSEPTACPAHFPWCGDGIEPIVVGHTEDCCPIYQCPCDEVGPAGYSDPSLCGCTYPVCPPDQELRCEGDAHCGGPCACVPRSGDCMADEECGPDMRCDTSACLPAPGCDPDHPDMGCPAVCFGLCVFDTVGGCRADSDCPWGQRCEMSCAGWGCVPSPEGEPCECPPDPNCEALPDGSCLCEGACEGQCVPSDLCDFTTPGTPECAPPPMPCPDPVEVGIDPVTCCPIYECWNCEDLGTPCPIPDCEGAFPVGTDPSCCPVYCCPDETGACPELPV